MTHQTKKLKIITISGLDGSGKSTQIEMLKKYLESKGNKVQYFHAVQFSIGNRILKPKKDTKDKKAKSVAKAGWFKIFLRKVAFIIDLYRFPFYLRKISKDGFDYLLTDRFFFDNLINIKYLSNDSCPVLSILMEQGAILPHLSIFLDTTPEEIFKRDQVPDQGIEYLTRKRTIYAGHAKKWNLLRIDGNQEKDKIFFQILEKVKEVS